MQVKKYSLQIVVLILVTILSAYGPGPSSSGAPASHTGAPGEGNCTESGCHDDHIVNSGTAMLQLEIEGQPEKIEAGKIYSLKVKIEDNNITRFGFQALVLEGNNNQNCGEFLITDSARTQIVHNRYKLQDRKYVTYTFNGTDAVAKGKGEWSFKWKAPEKLNTPVHFYISGVSANDDMSDKGDKVYTKISKYN
ncbi:MAG: hypothetical protein IPM51_02475 [Sphingobacteriaceae bacterium]|nr:hypothetical protein [Sphingobacteriaceae bacterium]